MEAAAAREMEEGREAEVNEHQRVALRTDTDVVPPTAPLIMASFPTERQATDRSAGSSSGAAPTSKARPRPMHVLPGGVYMCNECNVILRAIGFEARSIAIRRCRSCCYPLCQSCWIISGAKLHCPRCRREASDSDIDALQQLEDNPDFDIYDVVEDDFRYNNTGRSVFRGKGKGQGNDKGEGKDDPKGKGQGKE